MRPYLHSIDTFFEPIKSNFYVEIAKVAAAEPAMTTLLASIFGILTLLIIYNLYYKIDPLDDESFEFHPSGLRKERSEWDQ